MPLKGIKVTVSSDTQIGGAGTRYTNDEGGFRFAALHPGSSSCAPSAPKLQP